MNVSTSLPRGYIQNAIVNPAMQTFDAEVAPRIREGFANVGAFSSMQGSALANALTSTQTDINQRIAQAQLGQQQLAQQLNAQGALAARGQQATGLGLLGSLGGQQAQIGATQAQLGSSIPLANALGIGQALNPFQQNLGAQSQAQYQEFLRTAPENSPWTQLALGIIGQQQKAFYNPQNTFGQAIGNVGSLALLGGILGII